MRYSQSLSLENSQTNNVNDIMEKSKTQSYHFSRSQSEKSIKPISIPCNKSSEAYNNSTQSRSGSLRKSPRCYNNLYLMK